MTSTPPPVPEKKRRRRQLSEVSTTLVLALIVTGITIITVAPIVAWAIIAVLRDVPGAAPGVETVSIAAVSGLAGVAGGFFSGAQMNKGKDDTE